MRWGIALFTLLTAVSMDAAAVGGPGGGDSVSVARLPGHYLNQVDAKAEFVGAALSKKTTSYLQKLSRLEARILGKLHAGDSTAAAGLPAAQYQQLQTAIQNPGIRPAATYIPGLDTLSTTLRFLQGQPGLTGNASGALGQAGADVQQLQARFDESTLIQQYVSQRRQELTQLLGQYTHLPAGVTEAFANYKETAYYYRQQVEQYKAMLNDPDKMEREAVTILSKMPAYQSFLSRYSLLASLFRLPAGYGDGGSLQGLQTKDQVQQLLQQQVGGGGGGAVQGQLQAAQSQITNMQNSLSKYGAGGQDLDMPDFKPNTQKTKTFLKRLQYGVDLQFARAAYDFPATGNLGLSLGYKLSDKGSVGLGLSYSMGMGTDWSHIALTNQGVGLRSFLDWKIKKTWYVTGGYELNYMTEFSKITQLRDENAWQPSALVGIEKKYRVSSKVQGNVQLLFDALYKQEVPQGQMFRFRVGYNF